MAFTLKTVSSLEKVLPAAEIAEEEKYGEMLSNEKFAFQVVGNSDLENLSGLQLEWSGTLAPYMAVRHVDYVMALRTCMPSHDDFIIDENAQVFPDILRPLEAAGESVTYCLNAAYWVDVFDKNGIPAGEYSADFVLKDDTGKELARTSYTVRVYAGRIAENDLIATNWLHSDAICNAYGVQPMSDGYWHYLKTFMKTAAEHGFTMVYTPLFTPPLDTAVGLERMTVQTVRVEKSAGGYRFDFSDLDKYIAVAQECGLRYFEFSHLFSQWGAKACPKVEIIESGKRKKCFGWDTPSSSPEYRKFLSEFLPELVRFTEKKGIKERCFLHISDEPFEESFSTYKELHDFLKPLSGGIPLIDAVSHYKYFEQGCVDIPVVGLQFTEEFERHGAEHWVYTCCGPDGEHLSNRFINMPSLRNRILGIQMYKKGVKGYLHWGYNFYFTVFSRHPIDPFRETDADRNLQAGDPFIVYPGKNGAWASLRLETFLHGVQDYCALLALEEKIGRKACCSLLDAHGYHDYRDYPTDEASFLSLRREIDMLLSE